MEDHQYKLFKRLTFFAMFLAWCVVVLGAYVRLTDAGLGCPDWPGCYGSMTVPESQEAINEAQLSFPDKPVDIGRAWREMAHRYLAGTLGLVVLVMFMLSIKLRKNVKSSLGLVTTLLVLVGLQAALGMLTVTMLLKPVIVTTHLLGGMSTLALLTWIMHRHWGYASNTIISYPKSPTRLRVGLLLLFVQILLGGWTSTNYAALACTDFPMCHGLWVPDMDFSQGFNIFRALGETNDGAPIGLAALNAIQWMHRVGALVVLVYMTWVGHFLMQYWQLKRFGIVLMLLLLLQIGLGISNLVLHLPIVLAVSHNAVAALMLMVMVVINSKVTEKNKML